MIVIETKVCSKCKMELAVDKFNKQKLGKNGIRASCRKCQSDESIKYRAENSDELKERDKKYREENRENILKYKKQHYIDTKEYCIEYGKRYSESHKEAKSKRMKQYHEANKEHFAKIHSKYKKEHLEQGRMSCQQREARKRLLPHTLTLEQWGNMKVHFNNTCVYCGKELPLVQEHFIALSKGGEYTVNNIIPSCKSCNSSKSNKDFFEWYPKHKDYSKGREIKILKYLNYNNNIQQLTLAL